MKNNFLIGFMCAAMLPIGAMTGGCSKQDSSAEAQQPTSNTAVNNEGLKDIYFAGGCFWGVEEYFSRIPGVAEVTVGYANGNTEKPTYEQVLTQRTGHAETVHVRYDPDAVSLQILTEQFFKIIDPTSINRQGNDRGTQYRTGIYYVDDADRPLLENIMQQIQTQYTKPLAVELLPLTRFDPAEEYHQDYLRKNPGGYCHVDFSSLDDLKEIFSSTVNPNDYSKPSDSELRQRLSSLSYSVTQEGNTERAFTGPYLDNKEPGIYVDIATNEPLFLSVDKFDSGTGWPSFVRPIDSDVIVEEMDTTHGMTRVEVRSRVGDSHLGHVFRDGPRDRGGLRYCINGSALRFIPLNEMDEQGFGKYKSLVMNEK